MDAMKTQRNPHVGLNAVAGKAPRGWNADRAVQRHDPRLLRPGGTGRDMLGEGVDGECRTSRRCPRFGGALFSVVQGQGLADVCVTAWNDFMFDEWCPAAPRCSSRWPSFSSGIRRCGARRSSAASTWACEAVCIPEEVSVLGLPSYFSGTRTPFSACAKRRKLPICMHIQSSGWQPYKYPGGSADARRSRSALSPPRPTPSA